MTQNTNTAKISPPSGEQNLVQLDRDPKFPRSWTDLIDSVVPAVVKSRYSPRETWKNKPFTKDDVRFFGKGLVQLQETLTDDRESALHTGKYFRNPAARSSYILFYLPLHGAKFLTLYQQHQHLLDSLTVDPPQTFRVLDLGSGPGTASLAFLAFFREKISATIPLEFTWVDPDRKILEDGEAIFNAWKTQSFPDSPATVKLVSCLLQRYERRDDFDFVLVGNVLNECGASENDEIALKRAIFPLITGTSRYGTLLLEPASKASAQRLSRIRDEISKNVGILGPCLHSGKCPLVEGRDWCHFSVHTQIPGTWFFEFSRLLGGRRDWLKFSYLWIKKGFEPPKNSQQFRRVISDPIPTKDGTKILICQPETPDIRPLFRRDLLRGSLIPVSYLENADPVRQPLNRPDRRGKSSR